MPLRGLSHTAKEYQGLVHVYRKGQTCIVTHHNFPKRPGSKYIQNLVLLLLREAGGLREERIRQVRDPGHG
jgi:hypothetical protein